MTAHDYLAHLKTLAQEHKIQVTEGIGMDPRHSAANPKLRAVLIPEITSDVAYALALHEMGHIVAPEGHIGTHGPCPKCCQDPMYMYDLLKEEFAAWAWARSQALEWTTGMEQAEKIGIQSYLNQLGRAREAAGVPMPKVA